MGKLSDKIAQHNAPQPFFAFEFFPPRTDEGFANLLTRVSRMSTLDPIGVSVTWGAGGTTHDKSLDLAEIIRNEYGIDTMLHLTCTNMVEGTIDKALRRAKSQGIESILALRGDPPRGDEDWIPADSRFTHSIDLVRHIKASQEFSSQFCVAVAAYPDGHVESDDNEDTQLEHLKEKVDAGADLIITQLFYDVDGFLKWLKKVRARGITIPVMPGIMPLQNYGSFMRLTKLCGTKVPEKILADLEPIKHDDQKVKDYGVQLAIDMIKRVIDDGDVKGVHFCTLNLERSIKKILEGLQWTGASRDLTNRLIIDSSEDSHEDLTIKPEEAAQSATDKIKTKPLPAVAELGSGEINHSSTWDEFPNGRFGDFKSPAFGLQSDPWNSSVPGYLGISRTEALSRWGSPKTDDDLTKLFVSHLQSEVSSTPFSPAPLSAESLPILEHLEALTRKGWWTVFSQPAVDGVPSSDEVFGWGPVGGYVFQKGFVEFFVEESDAVLIEGRIRREGDGWIDFFAANEKGDLRTNVVEGGRNAVTWGVFPGQEIAQSTIIERNSFLSWKEEAFSIWEQWSLFYPPESEERHCIDRIRRERWLVSVVHHDYKNPGRLWSFLQSRPKTV